MIKYCIVCSKQFDARGNHKTCSKSCSIELKETKRKEYNKLYWSECKDYINKLRKTPIVYETRRCLNCSKTFEVNVKKIKKYCSKKCRNQHNKKNQIASYLKVKSIKGNLTNKHWIKEDINLVKKLRKKGYPISYIAKRLDRSYNSIRYICQRHSIFSDKFKLSKTKLSKLGIKLKEEV